MSKGTTPRTAGTLVDLEAHRIRAASEHYLKAIDGTVAREVSFFGAEKFMPFARSYESSGFDPGLRPRIDLVVRLRDDRPPPPEREFVRALRRSGFAYTPGLSWTRGTRPAANPNEDPWGPELTLAIGLRQARSLFAERGNSPFGAYQPSELGFRTAHARRWSERGIGFSIVCSGYDDRRGAHGRPWRAEQHIVDDERDLSDLSRMMAQIQRASLRAV